MEEAQRMPNLTYSGGKSSRRRKDDRGLRQSAIIITTLLSFVGPAHAQGKVDCFAIFIVLLSQKYTLA